MRSTFKILLYINKNKVKADDTTAIMCRMTIDGKSKSMTTGLYCQPDDWGVKKGETSNDKINRQLISLRQRIELSYETILKEQGVVSAELLKNTITEVNVTPIYILQAGEVERERLRVRSFEINSTSTYRQSKTTHSNLTEFINSRGSDDILFTDITIELGESFKLFLKRDKDYKPNHINHCLCWLNRLIYIAVDREVLRANPIEDLKYEKKLPPKISHISRDELKRIMDKPLPSQLQELARRVFIFSCFTSLAFVDVRNLHPQHIERTSDGREYIRVLRTKTKVESFIPLHPIAIQILSLYNTTDNTQPIFPLPVSGIMWREINEMGYIFGIKGNLSFHQARHSCGTLMLSEGIPIESISKIMGHTNISSTQIYAKITDQKISEDMDRLIERRKVINN